MDLSSLTDRQLVRLWRVARIKLCERWGVTSFDWPTLGVVHPTWYRTLRMIHAEGNRREL